VKPVRIGLRETGVGIAALGAALALALSLAASAGARTEAKPWPPLDQPGKLFVHFGEEHINDADGATLLPKVVHQSARYRPVLVTMSGDKANNGEPDQFALWSDVMRTYDRQGIPWLAGVGNHDRDSEALPAGVNVLGNFEPYAKFFADRPYPMGDAGGYEAVRPSARPADDPDGASSHYFADIGGVRWVFLDNSCWSIIICNNIQNPSGQSPPGEAQLDFLQRVARAAGHDGKLVFVVMHMPTEDPGDQLERDPTALQHTMGKGVAGVLDNNLFEEAAKQAGVDAVFVAHIKGQLLYEGEGGIPYFIDGGAGGELYTTGPVGTDHGFWHGFRLINVRGDEFTTDAVPIFVRHGITITGPQAVQEGERITYEAFGHQPVFNDPAKVPALELRDPDPIRPSGSAMAWLANLLKWAGPLLAIPLAFLYAALASHPRRRRLVAPALVAIGALAVAGVSAAQQSDPTSTPKEALPNPARMWTSAKPLVLRPVASPTDDPRRNPRTQTADGEFRAVCPGRTRLEIASGFETARMRVHVPSEPGPIVRSLRAGAAEVDGQRTTVASVGLDQRSRVAAEIRRNGRTFARLGESCERPGNHRIHLGGLILQALSPGRYRIVVTVSSDRNPVHKSFPVRVG
jgi:hypothetical protein